MWGTGEQGSGNRVVKGPHKCLAGTGCHQEAVALGQTRALCELPSRGRTEEKMVEGGWDLRSHYSAGRGPNTGRFLNVVTSFADRLERV